MISKSITCAEELISNPKSFFNCPDLHGGVPRWLGGEIGSDELANFKLQSVLFQSTMAPDQSHLVPSI
jgi:hypothetical protein